MQGDNKNTKGHSDTDRAASHFQISKLLASNFGLAKKELEELVQSYKTRTYDEDIQALQQEGR